MQLPAPPVSDHRLVRELVWVVVIKLALITALWWGFVRDAKVPVDTGHMAAQLIAPANTRTQPPVTGEHDDQ
ncbi:MAG: hypothetical protein Q7J47_21710 [Azoarcus sp.]|nr:hypothetical protein [Azoarcus sp.]